MSMIKVLNRLNQTPKFIELMANNRKKQSKAQLKLRIGISMGPVIAGGK